MSPWVFLDDLPSSLTSKQLEAMCSAYGRVLWGRVVSDPYGEVSTYGYVEMANSAEAEQAAKALDDTVLFGRPIRAMLTNQLELQLRATGDDSRLARFYKSSDREEVEQEW
jgi:RNA recognition motif-containing protein